MDYIKLIIFDISLENIRIIFLLEIIFGKFLVQIFNLAFFEKKKNRRICVFSNLKPSFLQEVSHDGLRYD